MQGNWKDRVTSDRELMYLSPMVLTRKVFTTSAYGVNNPLLLNNSSGLSNVHHQIRYRIAPACV